MRSTPPTDLYSRREIALAAGVSEADVLAVLSGGQVASLRTETSAPEFVPHDEAVRIGRLLADANRASAFGYPQSAIDANSSVDPQPGIHPQSEINPQFATNPQSAFRIPQSRGLPLAVSSTLHVALTALVFFATFNLAPRAASLKPDDRHADPMRLVFLATPGPGGGGGGGGLLQQAPPPKAMREGRRAVSSPLPRRVEPKPVVPAPKPPEPKPEPLKAEQLPAVIAPIITAPADTRSRIGVLTQTTAENDSHGPGVGGGAGTGKGTGLGEGDGSGIGPGSGGGTGGGPYRPGSGIEPPRLLREVKADYTEDARQRGIAGDVVFEIVVRRDGSVGDVRILKGLGGGLNDRAAQAVRQWRFAPAQRLGAAVDVIVEVAVEFKLR
jgi:TonB family protein